jgi:DNA-directed RNA polymerase subunit L
MKHAEVSYSGYEIVHPLKKTLIVRLALKENNNLEHNKKVFIDTITEIKKLTMDIIKDWESSGKK